MMPKVAKGRWARNRRVRASATMTAQIRQNDPGEANSQFLDTPKQGRTFATRVGACLAVAAIFILWPAFALATGPRVILLRGWFGVFSTGLDSIADQLKAEGIKTEVAGHLNWSNEVADILRDRAAGHGGPLGFVGQSQGANTAIDMARA